MKRGSCCRPAPRSIHVLGFVASAAAMVLVPKCPLCFAAWFAGLTGLGISSAAAGWLRISVLAGGSLIFLTLLWKSGRRKPESG